MAEQILPEEERVLAWERAQVEEIRDRWRNAQPGNTDRWWDTPRLSVQAAAVINACFHNGAREEDLTPAFVKRVAEFICNLADGVEK